MTAPALRQPGTSTPADADATADDKSRRAVRQRIHDARGVGAARFVARHLRASAGGCRATTRRSWPTLLRFGAMVSAQQYLGMDLRPARVTLRSGHPFTIYDRSELLAFTEVLVNEEYGGVPIPQQGTVIDCGANVGAASAYFRSRTAARIIAVEPDARSFARLVENTRLLDIECIHAPVSSKDGRVPFYSSPTSAGSSLIRRGGREETVDALTLSTLVDKLEIGEIALLKLDVEGAELDALAGAPLERVRAIVAEIHYDLIGVGEDAVRAALPGFTTRLRPIGGGKRAFLEAVRS